MTSDIARATAIKEKGKERELEVQVKDCDREIIEGRKVGEARPSSDQPAPAVKPISSGRGNVCVNCTYFQDIIAGVEWMYLLDRGDTLEEPQGAGEGVPTIFIWTYK